MTTSYSSTRTATWLRPLLSLTFLLLLVGWGMAQHAITYNASGTFTPPTGVTSVTVECWGGGGRGGSRTSGSAAYGGGGGGAYVRSVLTVVPGTSYTVTVGAGSTTTAAGGDSWFNATGVIRAKGGSSVADNSATGAAGGLASASVGTIKFDGGTGATATTNGGGGGSSAGTAAPGANGSVSAGGVAPTGGGNGGAGRSGSSGNGTDGSAPGGGGGGARRDAGGGSPDGGAGADGRVVITYAYTEATCLASNGVTLPDNGCGSNSEITVTLPQSGLPTTLGTAAGNAKLVSVELIVLHPYNADMEITLTSPGGTTLALVTDKGGSGDNLGNTATCPASPLILLDGSGNALPTGNTNITGTYAPETAYSGFTGNPNGNWVITICDDAALDLGQFMYAKLNFCTVVTPSVSAAITTGSNPACNGSSVTFTATPTNGGASPTYQWQKNGTNIAGATGVTYTATAGTNFVSTDQIRVVMTSNASCTTTTTATSTAITMTVTATVTPSVTAAITTGTNPACNGSSVTFTATPTNGGTTPTYQWQKGGVNIGGATGSTYTAVAGTDFVSTNQIRVVMTSNATCPSPATATSAAITMTVTATVTPSVTAAITTGTNPACNGSSVTFTATPTNGGASPTYQWQKNGTNIAGATGVTYSATAGTNFVNTDQIRVVMTSNATCPSPATATSTAVTMTVTATVTPSVTAAITTGTNPACNGSSVTFTATPTNGGSTPTYQWQKNGTNIGGATSVTYTATAGTDFVNTDQIRVVMTSNATCPSPATANSTAITMTVAQPPTTATVGGDQAICAGGATVGLGGSTAVVGLGTWSVLSGGAGTFSPNANTANATFTHTGGAGPVVLQWQIANAPCPASSATLNVTINQPPTTATVGGDQTICATQTTTGLGGSTALVGIGTWSVVSGGAGTFSPDANTANATFTHTSGAGPIVLRWTISNAPCTASTADVTITISATCTYFSRSTGDVTDPIWSLTPTGTAGSVTFTPLLNMVVQGGDVVTQTSNTAVRNVTVDAGGTLVLDNGTSFQVNGESATFTGSLTANDNSELELAGSSATTLTLAAPTSFYALTVNTPAGTTVTGTVHIRGTLLLQDGNFDCTGNPVVLRSTATYTGRLGPVAATASYTGNMRIERYIPAGHTNWRLVGSPIVGRLVQHLKDDFYMAGFPGSHYPSFDDPVGSGILWPSVRWYDETNTGGGDDDGMTGVSSNMQPLLSGQGFAAWCGTGLTTTTAFTMDLENQAPVIATSPISLPMSYTDTGNPAVDGWNLVSNPLPSPIAFDQIARGADVEDYITYFDPATGNMASYDISSSISQNGGSNVIQSMQGFFLKTSGSDVSATVSESAKVAGNSGGFFGGLEDGPPVLRLHLASAINTFSDETIIAFNTGSPGTDGDDVPKYNFAHPMAPQIASIGETGQLIAINAYGPYTTNISIPIMVDAAVTGTYEVTATGLENMGLSCLRIEDLLTGAITPLDEGAVYSFEMDAAADATAPRLMLHASAPLPFTVADASCAGSINGGASVEVVSGNSDVTWMNDMGSTIAQQIGVSGVADVQDLAAGDYQVSVSNVEGCALLTHYFTVEEPEVLAVEGHVTDASCPSTTDGGVALAVTGGTEPYTFEWSNASTNADLVAGAGTYDVVVTDAHDCEVSSGSFTIGAGNGPTADINADAIIVQVNTAVTFVNNSTPGAEYLWDFADGNTSTEAAPQHIFTVPGVYSVTLTVTDGPCVATTTIEITVETSTGIEEVDTVTMRAWMNGDDMVVEHGFADKYPVQLDVLNEAGQIYMQHKVAGPAGRFTIPASELASGIWYVRVSNEEVRKTIPVVIVR